MPRNPQNSQDETEAISFTQLLAQKQWDDYGVFLTEAPSTYARELEEDIKRERKIRAEIRRSVLEKFDVKKFENRLGEAEAVLFSGQVIGIDGTVSKQRTLSGLRCQIGIVAVNYFNEKIRQSYFISEANLRTDYKDILDVLKQRESKNRIISDMVIRALMLYREREVAVREAFASKYKMLHGPMLPFELMTGLGRLRALEATLDVLESIISDPKCFSIISSSTQEDYLTLGMALEPGEYLLVQDYSLGDEIASNEDFMAERKWRPSEFDRMKKFLQAFADQICIGVIKVSEHPYVFHAHKKNFDMAAAIIGRDSLLQREKGFPLLIDYADSLCSEYFPAGDFTNLLTYQIAKEGEFLAQMPERSMRLK